MVLRRFSLCGSLRRMGEFMQDSGNGIRINKFLSEAGVCSRREADREIEAGNVRIGERIAVTR